jgi:alpha-glucosidase
VSTAFAWTSSTSWGKEIEADDPDDLVALGHVPLNDVEVTHDFIREIRGVLESYPHQPVSVGEVYLFEPERVVRYYGNDDELHLSFNFLSLTTPWRAAAWAELIARTEASHNSVGAWPTWVLSNHDTTRVATRLKQDPARVRAALVLLLTLRGTPFLYAGEELGLPDSEIAPEQVVDPGGRDGCRGPLPWSDDRWVAWPSEPWLPFAREHASYAVCAPTT